MALKVANYNALRREADGLRTRYQALLKKVSQTDEQLASLQLYAKEVTLAYGIKEKLEGGDISAEGKLVPSFAESVEDYDFLRRTNLLALQSRASQRLVPGNSRPSIWPVEGRLTGPFGERTDPFSSEGAFHKGVDLSAPTGTPVHASADGIVVYSQFENGGYGRLVVIDHGAGLQTYYAHMSRLEVHVGQAVHRGDVVGEVGTSGRVTASHLHYEVRMGGTPQNPYRYMNSHVATLQPAPKKDFPF